MAARAARTASPVPCGAACNAKVARPSKTPTIASTAGEIQDETEGGVWKTTNRGTTFRPIFDNYGSYSIGCVTLDAKNPDIVFAAAEGRRLWCNAADDPANCSFSLMSVVRRGDIVVTIGTNGRSPALAIGGLWLMDFGRGR